MSCPGARAMRKSPHLNSQRQQATFPDNTTLVANLVAPRWDLLTVHVLCTGSSTFRQAFLSSSCQRPSRLAVEFTSEQGVIASALGPVARWSTVGPAAVRLRAHSLNYSSLLRNVRWRSFNEPTVSDPWGIHNVWKVISDETQTIKSIDKVCLVKKGTERTRVRPLRNFRTPIFARSLPWMHILSPLQAPGSLPRTLRST